MQDIIIASDHRGYPLKAQLKEFLKAQKFFVIDMGVPNADHPGNDAYPPIINVIEKVVDTVKSAKHFYGILICGDGIATSIMANRFKGIRAGLCYTKETAKQAREHNDINILCLRGEKSDGVPHDNIDEIKKIVLTYLNTKPIPEPRYVKRRALYDEIG